MSNQENARSEHADSVQQLPIPPGQSNVFTTLVFWFSFQPWVLAWEVLLRVCLQTFLLTLFQRLRFLQSLCFYGMWRKLSPDASRSSQLPPSQRQIQRSVTARSAPRQFSKSLSSAPAPRPAPATGCQSRHYPRSDPV